MNELAQGVSNLELGRAGSAALPAVLALLGECELLETGVPEALSGFVIAREGAELVACCGLEPHGTDGLLRSLAVRSRWRGLGVGAALVRAIVERASQERLSALYLLTTTAHDYFPRFGFAACSRDLAPEGIRGSWEFRSGCPATATLMKLKLSC